MKTHRWMFFVATAGVVAACGSRTGLLVPTDEDAAVGDALPPIDVYVPPDAPNPCPDAGSTLVYLVTTQNVLLSFYPPTAEVRTIGTLDCPLAIVGDTPFSMAVDQAGIAYVLYSDGRLFRVSTALGRIRSTLVH